MSTTKQASLLSFFGRTPNKDAEKKTEESRKVMTPKQGKAGSGNLKKYSVNETVVKFSTHAKESGNAEDSPVKQKRGIKRRRIITSDSESDSELKNDAGQKELDGEEIENEEATAKVEITKETNGYDNKTPKRKKPSFFGTPGSVKSHSAAEFNGEMAHSFISSFRATEEDLDGSTALMSVLDKKSQDDTSKSLADTTVLIDEFAAGRFPHLEFDFLKPNKIRDSDGRRPDHSDYCPRTLYVPEEFLKTQTPGHRQWWHAKSQYFDTVLFFKVGKFYEMYHMDAVIGVENLNLTYMRGKIAHCGFPEVAYGRFADQLVSRGFKVARVEQTETPSQLEERNRKERVRDKVVKREICRVTTPGTRTYGVLDGTDDRSALDSVESTAHYLYAFAEKTLESGISAYGVCFLDTSVGTFHLAQFKDDCNRSCLRTLLAHYQPCQILYERGHITASSSALLQNVAGAVPKEALVPRKEFLTPEASIKLLSNKLYLGECTSDWPETIREMLARDSIVAKCSSSYEQCISALGTVMRYLQRCLIDVDMITMRKFERYIPLTFSRELREKEIVTGETEKRWKNKCLILDGVSLYNLNIVPPLTGIRKGCFQDSTSSKYSLYNTINKCVTAFGKRLLRQWLCAPTCDVEILNVRQEAIGWLKDPTSQKFVNKAVEILRKVPDLERLAQKIHTLGLKYRAEEHPDGRAVMFEALRYNRRKINDLLITLAGFERVLELQQLYRKQCLEKKPPELLERCFGSCFPDIAPDIKHFQESFDHEKAKADGVIVPEKGVDAEYDSALDDITGCLQNLESYLVETRKRLRCQNINFYHTGRNRYHLEIPENIAKNLDSEYEMSSSRKGFKRMITVKLKELIEELTMAEQRRDEIRGDVMRRVFADFDCRSAKWIGVTERTAMFDVLLSLARYAVSCGLELCRPEFVSNASKPFLEIKAGYHPCLAAKMCAAKDFSTEFTYVPNDTYLGGDFPSTMLLTGPNMGGKSTLMRQVAVLVILAQTGSFVPAKLMRLSPVDRVFTRIGANDRLAAGQSTFFVELNEANTILRGATQHSLVLIDELGRGTSTHDGTAIAFAVLKDIAENLQCRTFFSTHYHTLCKAVDGVKNIMTAHMACVVDNENEADPTLESVTFLYKLTNGVCPKSYGFFAAKISGIKADVVRTAFAASKQIDARSKLAARLAAIRAVVSSRDADELAKMIAAL